MQVCVMLVATAALLVSSSVVTAPSARAATSLLLHTATTGARDCVGNAHSGGGEMAVTVFVQNTTTGVNYTLYDPNFQQPLNKGVPTPTFAGDSSGEVQATINVDVLDANAATQDIVVSAVGSYAPSNTQRLNFYACQSFTPYYQTAVTYSNVKITGNQCTLLSFDYAVIADRTPDANATGFLRDLYVFDYSTTYKSSVYNIVGATSSGGSEPGFNYSGSASMTVDNHFVLGDQETMFVQVPDPNAHDVTQDAMNMTSCTPVTPPANNPPVAVNDTATTLSNTAVTTNVTSNDTDANGNTLSVTSVTQPTNGTAAVASASSTTYTPNSGFVGNDSYTYTISDGNGGTATATVAVTVNAPTPPSIPVPVARLSLSPSSGAAPLTVHVDGSASTVGSGFVSYTYVWGDGQIDVSNSPTASHAYPQGRFVMALVVVNEAGHSIARQVVYSLPRTPRVFANETLTQGRAAIAAIHVAVGNTVYPAGHGATPPTGYKYVVSVFALQKRTSAGYSYTSLAAGQLIPYGSVVAVRLKLVLR